MPCLPDLRSGAYGHPGGVGTHRSPADPGAVVPAAPLLTRTGR